MADTSVQKAHEEEMKITRSSKTHSLQIHWTQIALKSLHKTRRETWQGCLEILCLCCSWRKKNLAKFSNTSAFVIKHDIQ
jgi:hypothetical protein